jgi:hypothetical protein
MAFQNREASMAKNLKLKKLKKLKRDYAAERQGYRDRQYKFLGETMAVVVGMRSDRKALNAFLKLSGKSSPRRDPNKPEDWLTSAAVAYVTGAKSESAIKLACKRARALDHLHDYHRVLPKNIATEIRARGGIEAVANLAAKEDPRRSKAQSEMNAASKSKKRGLRGIERRDEERPDDLDGELVGNSDWPPGNDDADDDDDMVPISLGLDLRTKLQAIEVGRRVKLIGIRSEDDGGDNAVLKVKKVILLKE